MRSKILLLLLFFLLALPVRAEEIQDFSSIITVQEDGKIAVTETIQYDFENLERHGIIRRIPLLKTNKEGERFILSVNSSLNNTTNDSMFEIKIGDPNKTVTGIQTYTIPYAVAGAITYFSDHDELYWNITGNEWSVPIGQASTTITLPVAPIQAVCYGASDENCTTKIDGNTVTANSTQPLDPNEGLTVVVSFPKGAVAVLEPTKHNDLFLIFFLFFGFIWYVLAPFSIIVIWFLWGRDPKVPGSVSATYDSPLSPAESGGLLDESVDTRDILATIVHLAQRGYFTIEERKKETFYLVRTAKKLNELLPFEEKLITGLFKKKQEASMKDKSHYETIQKVEDMIYQSLLDQKFFPHNPKTIRAIFYVVAGVAVFTFNFPLAIIAALFGRFMPRKTRLGAETAARVQGLKNFLVSQERFLKFQGKKQVLFEKLMPYAIAFGVEKLWAERFKDIAIQKPDWYISNHSTFSSMVFYNSIHTSFGSLQYSATVTTTSSSSGFSSGFSGGSSGGGGGGGGGGSW